MFHRTRSQREGRGQWWQIQPLNPSSFHFSALSAAVLAASQYYFPSWSQNGCQQHLEQHASLFTSSKVEGEGRWDRLLFPRSPELLPWSLTDPNSLTPAKWSGISMTDLGCLIIWVQWMLGSQPQGSYDWNDKNRLVTSSRPSIQCFEIFQNQSQIGI